MIDWYIEHHPFVLMVINILIARKLIHLIFFFFGKSKISEWRMKHISNRTHIQKQTGKQTLVAFGHSVNDNFEHHHHYRWRQYKSINRCCSSSSSSCWWREIIYHEIYVCVCVCIAIQFPFNLLMSFKFNFMLLLVFLCIIKIFIFETTRFTRYLSLSSSSYQSCSHGTIQH